MAATPSSSTTSASPPMMFLEPRAGLFSESKDTGTAAKDSRKSATKKFLARAEVSSVTRALRARLSYASYKATHNIPHIPLRDLEAQAQTSHHTQTFPRSVAQKRKPSSSNSYYNNTTTQPVGPSAHSRVKPAAAINPSTPGQAARSSAPAYTQSGTFQHYNVPNGPPPSSGPSLYSSILAPPASRSTRTVHNAHEVQPSSSSSSHGVLRKGSKTSAADVMLTPRSMAEGTRAMAKTRKEETKVKSSRKGKGKQKEREDADVDIKAAATLTSLLMGSRPSMSGVSPRTSAAISASSPRSHTSTAPRSSGSTGSVTPSSAYQHYQPTRLINNSSSRTMSSSSLLSSTEPSFLMTSQEHPGTPPYQQPDRSTTPKGAHGSQLNPASTHSMFPSAGRGGSTDSEAASLMLFLATSPSPARAITAKDKEAKDLAAFRTLVGNTGLRSKGRVLFSDADGQSTDVPDSTSSNVSGTAMEVDTVSTDPEEGSADAMVVDATLKAPKLLNHPPPDLSTKPAPTQQAYQATAPPPTMQLAASSSIFQTQPPQSTTHGPPIPGPMSFNFNDFINSSPSPRTDRARVSPRGITGGHTTERSSLRADVGRKLFEDQQLLRGSGGGDLMDMTGVEYEQRSRGGSLPLGASIDLMQST